MIYTAADIANLDPRRGMRKYNILVINPNCSTGMTDALNPILDSLNYGDVHFDYFTAPQEKIAVNGTWCDPIPSINSGEESANSALNCWQVREFLDRYDAFLVACYSAHPLVGILREDVQSLEETSPNTRNKYVTGIFEASITAALSMVSAFTLEKPISPEQGLHKHQIPDTFGIITTGHAWKEELGNAVTDMLVGMAQAPSTRFAGVETTGLTAIELHTTPPEEVKRRISEATQRLIQNASNPVQAICLGCAGMAGMEEAVRKGCIQAYGEKEGRRVRIVDGVVAGAGNLVTACKAGF